MFHGPVAELFAGRADRCSMHFIIVKAVLVSEESVRLVVCVAKVVGPLRMP